MRFFHWVGEMLFSQKIPCSCFFFLGFLNQDHEVTISFCQRCILKLKEELRISLKKRKIGGRSQYNRKVK
jgi:hypothetical protein